MLKRWIMIAALVTAAAVPGVGNAIVCYTLLDKGDNVLYQDSVRLAFGGAGLTGTAGAGASDDAAEPGVARTIDAHGG